MYTRIYIQTDYKTNKNIYHIWDDKTGYRTGLVKMEAYEPSPVGKYTSMFGEKLNKVTHFIKNDPTLIESDVNLETKTLIDEYLNEDEGSTENRIVFFDIEVDSRNGFPNVDIANNEVTAFSLYYQQEDKYYCVILDKENRIKEHQIDNKTIIPVKSEFDLLFYFIKLIQEIDATIISGWNSDSFDTPYLIHRCYKILGKDITKQLSPIGIISENPKTKVINVAGRNFLDYLLVLKKLHSKILPSYALNNVGLDLVNTGKVEFEGSLDDLYKNDINKFIEYNINDVVIIKKLDDKYKYINLTISLLSKCHVPINTRSITKSSVFLEGVILTHLRRKNLISKNKPIYNENENNENDSFEGAYVKEPILGRNFYIFDLDYQSLYPSEIQTLNISPETKIGIVPDWDVKKLITNELKEVHYNNKTFQINEFRNFLLEKNYTISPNGVLYNQNKKGIIPEILETWYSERQELRKLEKKYGDEESGEYNKELYEYYNRLQRSVKICLNSLYGVLGLKSFRFYDKDLVLSVTLAGQYTIKLAGKLADSYHNKLLENNKKINLYNLEENGAVFIDTDSCASTSIIYTDLYGKITIEELFNKLFNLNTSIYKKSTNNREFIFPQNCKSLYYDEKNKEVKYGHIQYIEKHKVKKEWFKLKTKSGKEVVITKDHSVMILRNNKLIEVKPLEIIQNDVVITVTDNISKYYIDKIRSIESLGEIEQDAYDLGMEDTPHTFFANNILVHNSIFFSTINVIKKLYPNIDYNDEDLMVEKTIEVAQKTQDYINKSFVTVAKHIFNSNNCKLLLKQEVVAKSSFFLAKKRYIQWIVNKNGIKLKEPELEMKAIDVVRSSYPIIFKKQLKQFCIDILNNLSESEINKSILSFERKLKQVPVIELAKNTSVHFQSDDGKHVYHDDKRKRFEYYKGTPAQVKAALFYNDLIDEWKLNKKVEKIKDGEKIKWIYLKDNTYGEKTIAIKTNGSNPEEIMDYIKENIDRRELYERELKTKIMAFYDILHWEYPSLTKELYDSFRQ